MQKLEVEIDMSNIYIDILKNNDPEVGAAIDMELRRQQKNIELIASENFVSEFVLAAAGSVLTNKYAEGYPKKRYYGGCECVDIIEEIAIDRAKKLYDAEHANVQAHSGANANTAVYFGLINPGDTILGMNLSEGGHLSHGSPVNISGSYYNVIPYGVDPIDNLIDYDEVEKLAQKHKPKLIMAGASAYPRIIDFKRFEEIAKSIGAYLVVDMAHIAGLIAAGLHPSPIPYADVVTSTTHKTLRGPRGGLILCKKELAAKIDKAIFPGTQGGPLMHIIAAKAVCFGEALTDSFKDYQKKIILNASALAQGLIEEGFKLVSGGTDNHLMLLDLRSFNITGKELEARLDKVNITSNKNTIPGDPQSPFITSGLRLGTPAITTRGLDEEDCVVLAKLIKMTATDFDSSKDYVLAEVARICAKYPLYN